MATSLHITGRGDDPGSVRKILDELNLNRASIDNDRRAYDKVRLEIQGVDGSLQNLSEQLKTFSIKLSELYETSACRSSDVNLFTVKTQVIAENCNKLSNSIEKSRDEWATLKRELIAVTTELLQCNMAFSKEWNCSQLGRDHRKNLQANRIEDLINTKKDLEYEMDDFLLMQRNVEYAEAERSELEKKFRSHEETIQEREAEIQRKIVLADEVHSKLIQQRQEKSPHGEELIRVSMKLEQQRAAISFWESRVSETHRIFESQKGIGKKSRSQINVKNSTLTSRLNETPTVEDQQQQQNHSMTAHEPSQAQQTVSEKSETARSSIYASGCDSQYLFSGQSSQAQQTQTVSENSENAGSSIYASSCDSQYLLSGQSKVRRMFQFKKKSVPLNEKAFDKNGNSSYEEKLPSFQSSLSFLQESNGKGGK